MKILFVTNIPSPYRVDFFNELGKKCDLTVAFEKGKSDERDKSWENYRFETFCGVFLRGKAIDKDTAICPEILKYVSDRSYDEIIIANISSPTCIIAVMYLKAHNISYWIEGDGAFVRPGNGIKNRLKTSMISSACGCFSTSKVHDEYYLAYGATKNKIHRYPFTSLKEQDLLNADQLRNNRDYIKNELGISEERVVLSVGQFIYRKGFDVLLKSACNLDSSVGVYIIGGIPTEEYTRFVVENSLENVHFIGFKSKDELMKYYAVSDVFVLPTRRDIWGLVVNEAMAFGLPIITTDQCIAGLELVNNGDNGYLIPCNDDRILTESINEVITSKRLEELGKRSREIISSYTIEKMVDTHVYVLDRNKSDSSNIIVG